MRFAYLDALRGMAVLWMLIFHFAYDMRIFGFIDWNFSQGFWYAFPRIIAFTFLFCVGISITLAHKDRIHWNALAKRSLRLGAGALIISLGTWWAYPSQWIFFGTLHCILVGSILGTLLVHQRRSLYLLLFLILVAQYGLGYDIKWVARIVQRPSLDFIPIYPWFWAILLGMVLGPHLDRQRWVRQIPSTKGLNFLSLHSFKIYLIHQPLFFGLLWLFSAVL